MSVNVKYIWLGLLTLLLLLVYPITLQEKSGNTIETTTVKSLRLSILENPELQLKEQPKVKIEPRLRNVSNVAALIGDTRLIEIAKCESKLQQFKNGKPLMSPTQDVGVMQINKVHWKRAAQLGLDIFYSTQDNITMGKLILRESGYRAWTCNNLV